MISTDNGEKSGAIDESNGSTKVKGHTPLHISTSQRGLIGNENPGDSFRDNSSAIPKRISFFKFGSLASPSAKFQRFAEGRDEISRTVPSSSSHAFRERFNRVFSRKLDWVSLRKISKEWIMDPMNMALFVWIVCVAVSGAILFLVMTGMLNSALQKKSQRDAWFEVNNQILNALFTLMCLYQHPKRLYHLVLLCRWKPEDISKLRKIYCKNGTYKPHEWAHMMVVVVLLHINCFAQYALCGLNLGYKRSERPAIGVGICISVAIAAPAIAGIYTIISPLGKEYHSELDEEAQVRITTAENSRPSQLRSKSLQKTFSFASRDEGGIVESRPKWSGGVLDIWDDISLAYLSLFCSFCVFGWNMERLGFGNMYVHIATFLLFCMAPFWIFNLAAVNINNEAVREALGVTGIFLCVFGLLYGGFWRIQMRKRFNLPPYNFCCGKPAVTDCALWLCCCWCSLAQEVRTGNLYNVVEDSRKQGDECGRPLPHEDGEFQVRSGPSSPLENSLCPSQIVKVNSPSPSKVSKGYFSPDRQLPLVEEESCTRGKDETMTPPAPSFIQRESN
uniref:PLAC8 family protein n=1 Tax=Davidia involucrata TaxID=16924 RepID=A0A5B6YK54_DAVIN